VDAPGRHAQVERSRWWEVVVGEQVRYFEDVAAGDEAPVRSLLLSRTDLVVYAGASGDFNPMHHDEIKATAAGQSSVFGHGMLSMGFLGSAITDRFGEGSIRRFRVRFVRQTWPDEDLRTRIVVTAKRVDGHDHLIDLDVGVHNEQGEEKVVGQATVVLPGRS
jgi:acyl dehydratase